MPRNTLPTKPPAEAAPAWTHGLSAREQKFVQEYIIDLNGTEAAVRAGLGKTRKSATEIASRMRKKARVAAAIAQLISERSGTTGVAVLNEIARLAFAKMTDFVQIKNGTVIVTDTDQLTDDQKAVIAEITETVTESGRTIRVKIHPKLDALDKLAKALRLYDDRPASPEERDRAGDLRTVREKVMARLQAISKRLALESPPMQTILPPPAAPKRAPAPPVIIDATAE